MAEKQWQTLDLTPITERYKLQALILGSWAGACSEDPYFKSIENIELGIASNHYTVSVQYDQNGIFSKKWYLPEQLEVLGIQSFSYQYRGILAQWASHIPYKQNLFQEHLNNRPFDLSLFPLFYEVYLTDRSLLFSFDSMITAFYDDFLNLKEGG